MSFDYSMIPDGFYDQTLDGPDGMRKFWHWHKFDSVVRSIETNEKQLKVLDVGCFSGSFAGRFLDDSKFNSTSIDILESQIKYARDKYGNDKKRFLHYETFDNVKSILPGEVFDVVTFIEVIEHLNQDQILDFFKMTDGVTQKGSQVIITTPNYISVWPLLEIVLNKVSDVKYEEQHITKFHYWNFISKLKAIYPGIETKYRCSILTTTHFISPYVSIINYKLAKKLSTHYPSTEWNNPFGSILILKLEKI